MKELDARYAKRVRTATAELIVYAKSMIKFMREYSDAMEKIGIVSYASYHMTHLGEEILNKRGIYLKN